MTTPSLHLDLLKVEFDYEAQTPDELTVTEDQLVWVLEDDDPEYVQSPPSHVGLSHPRTDRASVLVHEVEGAGTALRHLRDCSGTPAQGLFRAAPILAHLRNCHGDPHSIRISRPRADLVLPLTDGSKSRSSRPPPLPL